MSKIGKARSLYRDLVMPAKTSGLEKVRTLYLELLKSAITNSLYKQEGTTPLSRREIDEAETALLRAREKFGAMATSEEEEAALLLNWTPEELALTLRANSPNAHALVTMSAFENIQRCVQIVLDEGVNGDLMEAGVWRGGMCVFMRGLLKAFGDEQRCVWVADSFEGLPVPDPKLNLKDAIAHELLQLVNGLSISLDEVKDVFRRYDMLDERVRILHGWFDETLPTAPIQSLAVLRLDADYYESTKTALDHLYPKLSIGGFAIIDDYGAPVGARRAVDEYRQAHGISDELLQVNGQEFYWRKTR